MVVSSTCFSGSHHVLPPPLKHCEELACWQSSLTSEAQLLASMQPLPGNAYRVFLQPTRHCFPGPLEIFDSRSGRWKVGKSCDGPHEAKIGTAADVEQADLLQFLEGSHTLFAYRVESDEWSLVNEHFPTCDFDEDDGDYLLGSPYHLVRHGGQAYLVEVQCGSSYFRGFTVWKLCMRHSVPPVALIPGADWVKVASAPWHLWHLYGIEEPNNSTMEVKVISSGSIICMTAVLYTDTDDGETYYPPLVYNLVDGSWCQLPSYE